MYSQTSCAELLIQEKVDEDLTYEHDHLHGAASEKDIPLKRHEAQPCIGKKVATCTVRINSDSTLKLIFSGQT